MIEYEEEGRVMADKTVIDSNEDKTIVESDSTVRR